MSYDCWKENIVGFNILVTFVRYGERSMKLELTETWSERKTQEQSQKVYSLQGVVEEWDCVMFWLALGAASAVVVKTQQGIQMSASITMEWSIAFNCAWIVICKWAQHTFELESLSINFFKVWQAPLLPEPEEPLHPGQHHRPEGEGRDLDPEPGLRQQHRRQLRHQRRDVVTGDLTKRGSAGLNPSSSKIDTVTVGMRWIEV